MVEDPDKAGADFTGFGPVEFSGEVHGDAGQALSDTETARIMGIPGVVSVGLGLGGAGGGEAVVVGVTDAGVAKRLPKEVDGLPVIVTVTGEVDALPTAGADKARP